MTPEEKQAVAKWMGWHYNDVWNSLCKTLDESPKSAMMMHEWNPDSPDCPDSVWQEIYGRMDEDERKLYLEKLLRIKGFTQKNPPASVYRDWQVHTTTPAIRTKALLEVVCSG